MACLIDLEVLRFQRDGLQRLRLDGGALAGDRVLDVVDEVRAVHHAVVGERRDRLRELQRRVGVVALADAHADGLARKPLLLRRSALEALDLPFRGRQHADELALDVDAGLRAEAELADEARHDVDAEIVGEGVVVGVAGHDDRLVHVDVAVAARLVVAEAVVAEHVVAGVEDRLGRRALAELERGERHVGLERRARRIQRR